MGDLLDLRGLVKARTIKFWKRQLDGMARGESFITQLRADWTNRFESKAPFSFLAVGGERDILSWHAALYDPGELDHR
jgi:hypothetical protein